MKKVILGICLAWLCRMVAAQETVCVQGDWQFYYAKDEWKADSLVANGFYRNDFPAEGFDRIPVPSNWAVLGYEEPVYRGFKDGKASEGLYLKRFSLPESYEGKRVLLHFGGVWNSAEVWLNGRWVGRHDSGYTSFSFDVSKAVRAGEENVLAVRVRQVYPGYRTDTYDDWTLGGIYREVKLEAMPALRRVDRVRVRTRMDGEVEVRVMVADVHKPTLPGNYRSPGRPYRLRLTLTGVEGESLTRVVDVPAHTATGRETCERLQVEHPRLWSAETPNLYTLKVDLIEEGEVAQSCVQRVGIREITTEGGVFRINGQAVKLRGVNRHDEHPDVGRAVGPRHWLEDLLLMKAAHINYVRACHYQHAKGFIDLCDSIGMYVGAEVSLGGADDEMYNPGFTAPALLRTAETVERDLNNPSVIYWSIGNEDAFTDLFLQCARVAKALDPTRPVLLPWNADEALPAEIDILAPHYWTARQYDSIASCSRRPVITTEYVHAYGNQRFGGLESCWKALTCHPAGAGGAVWMWADQGLKTPVPKDKRVYNSIEKEDDYLRIDGQGWDGITDSYRRHTADYWEVKAVYCPVYPTVERVEWADTLWVPIYNGYDFTSLEGVRVGWQLWLDGTEKAKGSARLSASPHTEALLAVPTRRLGQPKDGQTAYLRMTFADSTGYEMGCRSVEIHTDVSPWPVAKKLQIRMDAATGLPEGIRPTIWHKLNDGDEIIRNRKGVDLDRYMTELLACTTEEMPSGTVTRAKARYVVNEVNRFDAEYVTTVRSDGVVTIEYAITPHVQTTYIPLVGLAMKMKSASSLRQWLGWGPGESYPNKRAAQMLGVWDGRNVAGTHIMRWAELDGVRVYGDYLDRDSADSDEVRILSHVLGRSEKGRLNYPEYRLEPGKTYRGKVTLVGH